MLSTLLEKTGKQLRYEHDKRTGLGSCPLSALCCFMPEKTRHSSNQPYSALYCNAATEFVRGCTVQSTLAFNCLLLQVCPRYLYSTASPLHLCASACMRIALTRHTHRPPIAYTLKTHCTHTLHTHRPHIAHTLHTHCTHGTHAAHRPHTQCARSAHTRMRTHCTWYTAHTPRTHCVYTAGIPCTRCTHSARAAHTLHAHRTHTAARRAHTPQT